MFYTDTNGQKPHFRNTALVFLEMTMENSQYDIDFEKFFKRFNEAAKDVDEFLLEDDA
jgi:hypothetical protein